MGLAWLLWCPETGRDLFPEAPVWFFKGRRQMPKDTQMDVGSRPVGTEALSWLTSLPTKFLRPLKKQRNSDLATPPDCGYHWAGLRTS